MFLLFILSFQILAMTVGVTFYNRKNNQKLSDSLNLFIVMAELILVANFVYWFYSIPLIKELAFFVYWITLLLISIIFLSFVHVFLNKPKGILFYTVSILNIASMLFRATYPIDFMRMDLWIDDSAVLSVLSASLLSLPIFYAIYLLIKAYKEATISYLKKTFKKLLLSIFIPAIIAIIAETIMPLTLHLRLNALWIYIVFPFMSYSLYSCIQNNYLLMVLKESVYNKLYVDTDSPILLFDKNNRLLVHNKAFKTCFKDLKISIGMQQETVRNYFKPTSENNEVIYDREGTLLYYKIYELIDAKMEQTLIRMQDITSIRKAEQEKMQALMDQNYLDSLTSLYNRRYLDEQLMAKTHPKIGLMFIDVDNFKDVNDRFGHEQGDMVIRLIATTIQNSIREDSRAIRFGGDEFVVFVPSNDIDILEHIAHRISRNILALNPTLPKGLNISVSIGLTAGVLDINEAFSIADRAMYQAKNKGKAQIFKLREAEILL